MDPYLANPQPLPPWEVYTDNNVLNDPNSLSRERPIDPEETRQERRMRRELEKLMGNNNEKAEKKAINKVWYTSWGGFVAGAIGTYYLYKWKRFNNLDTLPTLVWNRMARNRQRRLRRLFKRQIFWKRVPFIVFVPACFSSYISMRIFCDDGTEPIESKNSNSSISLQSPAKQIWGTVIRKINSWNPWKEAKSESK